MKLIDTLSVTFIWLVLMALIAMTPVGYIFIIPAVLATVSIYEDAFREDFPNGWHDILIDPAMLLLFLPQRKK